MCSRWNSDINHHRLLLRHSPIAHDLEPEHEHSKKNIDDSANVAGITVRLPPFPNCFL